MFIWTLTASIILLSASEAAHLNSNRSTIDLLTTPLEHQVEQLVEQQVVVVARNSSEEDDDEPTTTTSSLQEENDDSNSNNNNNNLTLAEEVVIMDTKVEEKIHRLPDTGTYERMGSFLTMSNFLRCLNEAGDSSNTKRLFDCTNMFSIRPHGRPENAQNRFLIPII